MKDGIYQPVLNDLAEIYQPESWLSQIAVLNQLILGQNVLISVRGEHGCGKSTFAKIMQTKVDRSVCVCMISANHLFSRDRFVKKLAASLNYAEENSLSELVKHINEKKIIVLLMIDNAECLSAEIIHELFKVISSQDQNGCFRVCLFSDLSLEEIVTDLAATEAEFNNIVHNVVLGDFTEQETKEFVLHRAQHFPGMEKRISDERLRQFYELTEGNLVGINTQMLGFWGSELQRVMLRNKFKPYIIAGSIAAIVGALAYISQTNYIAAKPKIIEEARLFSEIPYYMEAANHQNIESGAAGTEDLATNSETVAEENNEEMVAMESVLLPAPVIVAKAEPQKVKINHKPSSSSPAPKKIQNSDNGAYTVQLLASTNKQDVQDFIASHQLGDIAKIMMMQKAGVDWYLLTLGQYAKLDDAKQAAAQLPDDLLKRNPWVRSAANLRAMG